MRQFIPCILLLITGLSRAAVYIEQGPNGVTYSDTPTSNAAKKIEIPQTTSSAPGTPPASSAPLTPSTTPTAPSSAEVTRYSIFLIISPKDQETIQNQPVISVEIKLTPDLKPNHHVQLYLDDKPAGPPRTETQFNLEGVERGTHQLSAVILDEHENIIQQSNTPVIYVHRTTTQSPARQPIPSPPPLPVR